MGSLWDAYDTLIRIVTWTATGEETTLWGVINGIAVWLS